MALLWLFLVTCLTSTATDILPEIGRALSSSANGDLRIAGSSTVLPVAQVWKASVLNNYSSISLESGGSSSGARRVCHPEGHADKVDIGDMSRAWKSSEAVLLDDGYTYECLSSGIRVTQIAVGVDGLAVIVAKNGVGTDCLTNPDVGGVTLAMLRWIFTDWSDTQLADDGVDISSVVRNDNNNGVKEWSDIHESCAQVAIDTYGAGDQSGTYDFFGEAIFCEDCFAREAGYVPEGFASCPSEEFQEHNGHTVHRMELMTETELNAYLAPGGGRTKNCYVPSESDEELFRWIAADGAGIGYFGFAHYASHSSQLTAVRIANDKVKGIADTLDAVIEPSSYSITDGSYDVFRRDLFMNVDNSKWDVASAFLEHGFSDAGQEQLARETGYIRVNAAKRARMAQRLLQKGNPAADYISVPPASCPEGSGLTTAEYINAFGTRKTNYSCQVCQPGFSKEGTRAEACTPCTSGMSAGLPGQFRCSFCAPGKFSHSQALVCSDCPPNTMAAAPGMATCSNCSAGTTSATPGSSSCHRCALGSYRVTNDSGFCTSCPVGRTTAFQGAESPEDCRCAPGSYETADAAVCATCPEGVQCAFGSKEVNIQSGSMPAPQIEPSYFSFYSDPLSVYKCLGATACPGGSPEACGEHSGGVVCGRCEFGFVRISGACVECEDIYKSRILWPIIPLVLGPPVIYGLYCISLNDVEEWGKPLTGLAAMAYITLVNMQVIGLSTLLNVEIPTGAPTHGIKQFFSNTLQFETLLRPECAINTSPAVTFITRMCLPVFTALVFVFTYAAMRFLPKLPALNVWVLVNVYGGVFNTFYITIANAALGLFQCYIHPNGKSSVRDTPDILCYESEWYSLVGVAVPGLIMFCLLPIAIIAYVVRILPVYFEKNANFRLSIKFIARKFCPQEAWWTIVLLLKGLWINMATVFFTDGASQILWLNIGLLAYAMLTMLVLPWRHYMVSYADILAHSLLSYLFTMQTVFLVSSDEIMQRVATATLFLIIVDFTALFCCCSYLAFRHFCPKSAGSVIDKANEMSDVFSRAAQQRDRLASLLVLLPGREARVLEAAMRIIERESNVSGHIVGRFSAQTEKFDAFHQEAPAFEPSKSGNSTPVAADGVPPEDLVYGAPQRPTVAFRRSPSIMTISSKGSSDQTRSSPKPPENESVSAGQSRWKEELVAAREQEVHSPPLLSPSGHGSAVDENETNEDGWRDSMSMSVGVEDLRLQMKTLVDAYGDVPEQGNMQRVVARF